MKTLSNDIARCRGVIGDKGWREGCETCLRRIAERPDGCIMIVSPRSLELVNGKCPCFIDG